MALTDKLSSIADAIRGKTGKTNGMTLDQMASEIAGLKIGGGGVTVTEYVVTEDADRSLWLNGQKIKLVKGINLIAIGTFVTGVTIANNRTGLTTLIIIFWNGNAGSSKNTTSDSSMVRAVFAPTNGYALASNILNLVVGNTSEVTVDEDGLLTFTTSATGVTTGNYNNSFIGAGNTYYLLQAESEAVY